MIKDTISQNKAADITIVATTKDGTVDATYVGDLFLKIEELPTKDYKFANQ